MQNQHGAKLRLIFAMAMFGTIGLFVRAIPLPSSVIALVRGAQIAARQGRHPPQPEIPHPLRHRHGL